MSIVIDYSNNTIKSYLSSCLLYALPFFCILLFLSGCGIYDRDKRLPWYIPGEAKKDTFQIVKKEYDNGNPRYVLFKTGVSKENLELWKKETLSPRGIILKRVNYQTGEVLYYNDLDSRLNTVEGFQRFLQGMWKRKKPIIKYKEIKIRNRGKLNVRLESNIYRSFNSDTLVMNRELDVKIRREDKLIGKRFSEVGFDVKFRPPREVVLEKVLYRRRSDSSEVLRKTKILPQELQKEGVVDTLRFFGPSKFRVMNDNPFAGEGRIYNRKLSGKQLDKMSGSFPWEKK